MINGWANQAYLQGFDFEAETYRAVIKLFKRMDTTEQV